MIGDCMEHHPKPLERRTFSVSLRTDLVGTLDKAPPARPLHCLFRHYGTPHCPRQHTRASQHRVVQEYSRRRLRQH
jgi:hypothetical protein